MAQLIQEYSSVGIDSQLGSTETSIMWVLSLEELTPDLIVDRGEGRPHHYHLTKATMDGVCTVVTAQQTFIQQAAALIMEGKPRFTVDPKDTLIPILQGTSSLPQLYMAWKVLISRMRLGVKTCNTFHSSTDSGWNPPESYPFLVHSKEKLHLYKRNYHKRNKLLCTELPY